MYTQGVVHARTLHPCLQLTYHIKLNFTLSGSYTCSTWHKRQVFKKSKKLSWQTAGAKRVNKNQPRKVLVRRINALTDRTFNFNSYVTSASILYHQTVSHKTILNRDTVSAQRYSKNSFTAILREQLVGVWSVKKGRIRAERTLLRAAAMTLSTDTQRLSECLVRPFVARRRSAATAAAVSVACWSVSNWPSIGDRRWPLCRRGDVASVNTPHWDVLRWTQYSTFSQTNGRSKTLTVVI